MYDPVSNTFAVGKPLSSLPGSPHQQLATAIGANESVVVGGTFLRNAKGDILTTEQSGHYGINWTDDIRVKFTAWLQGRTGVPVVHQKWGG